MNKLTSPTVNSNAEPVRLEGGLTIKPKTPRITAARAIADKVSRGFMANVTEVSNKVISLHDYGP